MPQVTSSHCCTFYGACNVLLQSELRRIDQMLRGESLVSVTLNLHHSMTEGGNLMIAALTPATDQYAELALFARRFSGDTVN